MLEICQELGVDCNNYSAGGGICIVFPVMRKDSFAKTVKHYLSLPAGLIASIVVVDFDCNDPASKSARKLLNEFPHIYLSIPGHQYFNKSLALNIGIGVANRNKLLVCDADVQIEKADIQAWYGMNLCCNVCICLSEVKESETEETRSAPGIVLAHKSLYERICGYCSDFRGWGFEDHDFLSRARRHGAKILQQGRGIHLTHRDAERVRNYHLDSKALMRSSNIELYEARQAREEIYGTMELDTKTFWRVVQKCGYKIEASANEQ